MSINKNVTSAISNKGDSHYGGPLFKYMLSIDRLVLNLTPMAEGVIFNFSVFEKGYKQDELGGYRIGDSYYFCRNNILESNYAYSFNIHWHGDHVGTIHFNSRTANKRLIKLEFENAIFYRLGTPWYDHYLELCRILGFKLNNISQLHICLDSVGMYDWFAERYCKSSCMPSLTHEPYYKPLSPALHGHIGTQFIIGNSSSGKVNVLYKKDLEIKHSNKKYITDAHLLNGLDLKRGVDRLEARLSNKWLSKFDIKLVDLITQDGLGRIFAIATKELGFRDLKGPQVRDRHDNYKHLKLPLVDPLIFDGRPLVKVRKDTEQSVKRSERAITASFKNSFDEYIRLGRQQSLWSLRFYMDCEENFIGLDMVDRHNGLIGLKELSRDKYRALVRRYRKNYTRDRKDINEGIVTRLKSIEHDLFQEVNAFKTVKGEGNNVRYVNALSTIYNTTLFYAPPKLKEL